MECDETPNEPASKVGDKAAFALIDCNNFYASCERAFNPSLQNRPVVVLSNSDGCIVACSNEIKALGIPIGAPYHEHKSTLAHCRAAVLSSNYQLYGDMSQRIMRSLRMLVSDVEVYSIDEAFLRLDQFTHRNLYFMAANIRRRILQWTGIPTSIGIAPTKTLSKIANHFAKRHTKSGVFDIRGSAVQENLLSQLPVESIWGISQGWGAKLRNQGINTAWELRNCELGFVRRRFSVVCERIVRELRGLPCLGLTPPSPKKSILTSRSFKRSITSMPLLEQAMATFSALACEKLRKQQRKARAIQVFVRTNRFQPSTPQYRNEATFAFDLPTSNTALVISTAKMLLRRLYKDGYAYKKCGILLFDLTPETLGQNHLFNHQDPTKHDKLMRTMDEINHCMGADTILHLAQGMKQNWRVQGSHRSPRYTTQWDEIPRVN